MELNIKELLSPPYSEPTFFVNYRKIVRPRTSSNGQSTYRIEHNEVTCWKIQEDSLIKKNIPGIFFDQESYIIHWQFDIQPGNNLQELFHWKGLHASKSPCPLPLGMDQDTPVTRVVQWSEPFIFFYSFPKGMFTFAGCEESFDVKAPHLLMSIGEVPEEIHFYEVPCLKGSLRSRGVFLLVVPSEKSFVYWIGNSSNLGDTIEALRLHEKLILWQNSWRNFLVRQFRESDENCEIIPGGPNDYYHITTKIDFIPRLFYLNFMTGRFLATEVEYPLRASCTVPAFPFLQSHLYTALQPALFLLDNNNTVWLWEGVKADQKDNIFFDKELILANELVERYLEEKHKVLSSSRVILHHVHANKEPLEFKNLFPYWEDH